MGRSSNYPAALFLRIVLWLLAFVTITPFLLLLLTSIKSKADVLKGAFALPAYPHFENYFDAWNAGHFNIYFWNSIVVVIPVVAASVFLGLLTGFAFAYLSFPLRRTLFAILTLGMTAEENTAFTASGFGIVLACQSGVLSVSAMTRARSSEFPASTRAALSAPSTSGMPPTRLAMIVLPAPSPSSTI